MIATAPKIVLALTAALSIATAHAQDTTYVHKYGHRFAAKAFTFNDNFSMSDSKSGLNYVPHSHSGIGIGIWTKYFPFDIAYRHEVSFAGGEKKYKKTGATDMHLKGYCRFFAGDIYIQHYTGFLESESDNFDRDKEKWETGTFDPDLSSFYFAAVGDYIFNHERFSYNAGFNASQQQKISAGSALAGLALYNQRISSDSTLFLGEKANLESWSMGVNGGYAYNFVVRTKFLFFIAVNAGINASNSRFNNMFGKGTKIAPSIHGKIALWYNMKNSSLGVTATGSNIRQVFDRRLNMFQNSSKSELIFVRRFWYKKQGTMHNS